MNFEIENREISSTEQAEDSETQHPAEITTLPFECFKLVGGGDAIVLVG
jgi:hypothetical protein